jgi:hypothetical protein
MRSAFGVEHGQVSKGLGGILRPAGRKAPAIRNVVVEGKRRAAQTVTGGAQTGGAHRAGGMPYKGRHAG